MGRFVEESDRTLDRHSGRLPTARGHQAHSSTCIDLLCTINLNLLTSSRPCYLDFKVPWPCSRVDSSDVPTV